jgi:hypothetical protein
MHYDGVLLLAGLLREIKHLSESLPLGLIYYASILSTCLVVSEGAPPGHREPGRGAASRRGLFLRALIVDPGGIDSIGANEGPVHADLSGLDDIPSEVSGPVLLIILG